MTTQEDDKKGAMLETSQTTLACRHEHGAIPMDVDPGRLVEWRCMEPGRPERLQGRWWQAEKKMLPFTELLTGAAVLKPQAGAARQGHYTLGAVHVQGAQMRAAQTKYRHGQAQQTCCGDAQSHMPQSDST